jgi:hypothetical protein
MDKGSASDTPVRIRTRHRFLGIQPSDIDDGKDFEDETAEPRVQQRKRGGSVAEGSRAPSRADKASRGRRAGGGKTPNFHPGGEKGKLHRELGIPVEEKIPEGRLASAARSGNPEIRRDAIRAETMKKWHKS